MQDKELYRQLLWLKEPWEVSKIGVDIEGLRIDVWGKWPIDEKAPCPECEELGRIQEIEKKGSGGIWIQCSFRQYYTQGQPKD